MIIINITSFNGITPGAKHLYAKYSNTAKEPSDDERAYIEKIAREGHYSAVDTELIRYPTHKEAKLLANDYLLLEDIINRGTIRFDNLRQVEYEINKLFPDEEKVWYYCRSMSMFEKMKGRLLNS